MEDVYAGQGRMGGKAEGWCGFSLRALIDFLVICLLSMEEAGGGRWQPTATESDTGRGSGSETLMGNGMCGVLCVSLVVCLAGRLLAFTCRGLRFAWNWHCGIRSSRGA